MPIYLRRSFVPLYDTDGAPAGLMRTSLKTNAGWFIATSAAI